MSDWDQGDDQFDAEEERRFALGKLKAPAITMIIVGALGVLNTLSTLAMYGGGFEDQFAETRQQAEEEWRKQGMSEEEIEQAREAMEAFMGPMESFVSLSTSPVLLLASVLVAVLMILGGVKMMKGRSMGLAKAGSIAALVPCLTPCCLGLPFGIWALVVLSKPEVREAFVD